MFTNISKLRETNYQEVEKIVLDVEKEFSCPSIKTETHAESVD